MSSTDLAMFDGSTQLEGEAFRVVLSVEKTKSINTSVKSGETECAIVFSPRYCSARRHRLFDQFT